MASMASQNIDGLPELPSIRPSRTLVRHLRQVAKMFDAPTRELDVGSKRPRIGFDLTPSRLGLTELQGRSKTDLGTKSNQQSLTTNPHLSDSDRCELCFGIAEGSKSWWRGRPRTADGAAARALRAHALRAGI